ncbi:uncharacterized protein DS421_11g324930 [Arachis hypogaea]|nr:uncharacterized protein DS421_11g324930 [Arachis hypogaea]
MGDDPVRLYRLDGVAHIAGVINDEFSLWFMLVVYVSGSASGFPQRCIASMRRQQGMRLDEKYVPYLQMSRLYHLARLNDRWFRLDEPLVSAFVERWHPETHTFYMPFGECTITLQDVTYQLGLPVDRRYELLGVLPLANQIQKFAVNCTWFQEAFGECPEGADEETVRRYACAYIMMLLGTQLFADKSGNHIHIRWLPYVARLEEMGSYNWGSAALAWLAAGYDTFSWPLASRWAGHNPSASEKGPRVQMWRLRIDLLQARDFIWMPYNSPDILQVLHPEVLESRHTALIYFAVIEWHQIDRVLPQFGRVQPRPQPALNIDFLMSKDGRGRDRWFPYNLQFWHLYWDSRANHVLRFDVVADPGPSHDFLEWWGQHGKRFLSPEMYLGDPRAVPIPVEATQRGAGRVPDIDLVDDVLDRRRVERRARVGTRRSQREWRWLDQAMEEDDAVVRDGGRRRGRGG